MEALPLMSFTTFSSTPAARARGAAPWRRAWSRLGGRPAGVGRARKCRGCRATGGEGPPTPAESRLLAQTVAAQRGDGGVVQGDDAGAVAGLGRAGDDVPVVLLELLGDDGDAVV